MVGETLGHYEILERLGAGGMGEVYRARDTTLDRDVAIKVLSQEFATDANRLARLEREAKLLASLNHPHIAAIYSLEESEGTRFLVLELVKGKSLAQMLSQGALPVQTALEICLQIAEALEAAHHEGIVHRDLKPANVVVTPDARAKVLDFGIAKVQQDRAGMKTAQLTNLTVEGTLIGTAAYMSPEQIRCEAVDTRSDIWAFGCVLFETLAGSRAFHRETVADTMAAIIELEPDWSRLPAITPPLARSVLARCLRKDPHRRLHDIADVRIELQDALEESSAAPSASEPAASDRRGLVLRTFRLGEDVCRKLDRSRLDSRMIGSDLQYLDNEVPSDILVVHLHGMGLDHRDWKRIFQRSSHRCVAPTQVGFEPQAQQRFQLSMGDHAVVTREFIRYSVERLRPSKTVLVGFSSGADLGFHMLTDDDQTLPIDGFLPLDCNLSLQTCIVSRLIAEIPDAGSPDLLGTLVALAGQSSELGEWLNINEYLVKVFRKFHSDVSALRSFAGDVIDVFSGESSDVFPGWYRAASSKLGCLRCIFSDTPTRRDEVSAIRLGNLDSGTLGDHYTEASIVMEPGTDHFDLMDPERVLRHVGEVVAEIG